MTTDTESRSAVIYQFPPRGRFAASNVVPLQTPLSVMTRDANIVFGSGWYHDEAIQDAERTRSN